jgi:transposase-like protein
MEVLQVAACLIVKSVVLSAQWAGQRRRLYLQRATLGAGEVAHLRAELMVLRDENHRLDFENRLLRSRLREAPSRKRYSLMQRLQILWHLAYYDIARKRVTEHLGIAKSTFYRWLHAMQDGMLGVGKPATESTRKTPAEIARLIWDIFQHNPYFGRKRIAMTLWALRVFVSASTVRNVLLRPAPPKAPAAAAVNVAHTKPRPIVARYPNHVRSVDHTRVWRWHVWPTWVLVGIDHYSRMVTTTCPLEGPNVGWVTTALELAFARYGAPRHIIYAPLAHHRPGPRLHGRGFPRAAVEMGHQAAFRGSRPARLDRRHRTGHPRPQVRVAPARPAHPWPRPSRRIAR